MRAGVLRGGVRGDGVGEQSRHVSAVPDADEARIRLELAGNLCRCTGYRGIVQAIASVLSGRRQALSAATAAPEIHHVD